MKNNWSFILVCLVALIARLGLAIYGSHIDLIINAGWGSWLYENGPRGFYSNAAWIYGWPTQLPIINWLYSFNVDIYKQIIWLLTYLGQSFIKHGLFGGIVGKWFEMINWFGWRNFGQTPFLNGYLYSMKIIPILADIFLAVIVYVLGKKKTGVKKALLVSVLFLVLPFSWYISSLWGQYDGVAALMVLVSFILLAVKKRNIIAYIFSLVGLFVAFEIKPNLLVISPFYLLIVLTQTQKRKLMKVVLGGLIFAGLFIVTTVPFSGKDVVGYTIGEILPVVINPDRLGLTTRTFNFWQFLSPGGGWADSFEFLGIKAVYWGVFGLTTLTIIAVRAFLKNENIKGILTGLFIISAGAYIFGTGMVDRYYFLGVTVFGILTFYYPKLIIPWLIGAIFFSFNLFYSWGYPFILSDLAWKNLSLIRIGSFIQTLNYVFAVAALKQNKKQ